MKLDTTVFTHEAHRTVQTAPSLPQHHFVDRQTDAVWMVALTTLKTGDEPTLCAHTEATTNNAHVLQ